MKILIPDSLGRNIIAAIDSLKKEGHIIYVASPSKNLSNLRKLRDRLKSGGVSSLTWIATPFDSIDHYIDDVLRLVSEEHFDVVLPFTHACVAACTYAKDRIEKFASLPFPDFDKFMIFHDKWTTALRCQDAGIPIPKTFHPEGIDDLLNYRALLDYPVVVKAQIGCGIKNGVRIANDWNEVLYYYSEMTKQESFSFLDNFERPIIQEYVPGEIRDVVGVFKDGEPLGILSQKRYITYPIDGGTGSVNITTHEPQAIELSKRLMLEAKWTGPAMCEYKLDSRTNQYKLLEVNPKFWGTLGLSINAGMPFPIMTVEMSRGKLQRVSKYTINHMYRWSLSDEIKSLSQYSSKMKAIQEYFMRTFRRNKSSEFSFRHPFRSMVTLLETLLWLRKGDNRKLFG